jgi:hypothetical protein
MQKAWKAKASILRWWEELGDTTSLAPGRAVHVPVHLHTEVTCI